jgi:flagellar biosynthesis/type III secretory pathway protein FliH
MGDTPLYEELVELIIKVSDHLLAAYETLQKRVRKAMGGEVLELWRERAERLEREAEARGIERGIEQGIERGIEQGIEQGIEAGIEQGVDGLAAKLRELGIDEQMLGEAISSMKAERDKG